MGTSHTDANDQIRDYLARGGKITRCPVAAVAPTQASLSSVDRRRLAQYGAEREAAREHRTAAERFLGCRPNVLRPDGDR
jgi:hypothetical protein